eukprot:3851923-Amphidinium_carterae.1
MAHGGPAADPQVSADLSTGIAAFLRARWIGPCRITCGTTPSDRDVEEVLCETSSNLRRGL